MGSQGMYFFACQLLSDNVSHKARYNGKVDSLKKADKGLTSSVPFVPVLKFYARVMTTI